jgi:hypothetical protein
MDISGGQIVISRIETEQVTPTNASFAKSFFRPEEQMLISRNTSESVFVSIDTHVGMGLLSICERIEFSEDV